MPLRLQRRLGVTMAMAMLVAALAGAPRSWGSPAVESQRLRMVLRDDLNGPASLLDRATNRDYAARLDEPVGLYRLSLGRSPSDAKTVTSRDAVRRRCVPIEGGLELTFEHEGRYPLHVVCRVMAAPREPAIRWHIRVANQAPEPLIGVEFPLVACPVQLGESSADDAVVYPGLEGSLLADPATHMKEGQAVADPYPGVLSAQFLYFFDPAGGLYVAAADGGGHPKALRVQRRGTALLLSVEHRFPSQHAAIVEPPYDVVWSAAGGRWEDGAELYRDWAAQQPWCARTIAAADVPAWLKRPTVFLNYSVLSPQYATVELADANLKKYRDFLDTPVVACAFSWERHGTWIGPDFFPPVPDEAYYVELSKRLAARGDHTHLFTSGFRWGVKKPVREERDPSKPRVYTDYDGTDRFLRDGKAAAATDPEGQPLFSQPAWADNYILCPGSEQARRVLAEAFWRVYGWGVAGVDLDQNIGAGCSPCFSTSHQHPPGAGVWQHQAMAGFLQTLREKARTLNRESFIGVEEPCEAYIPWIDIYHGRAFTATHWPARGPAAVSIPLYLYLYHEYQPGYAGWIDAGFSPAGNERLGLGRAFLFGMQPGVRIHGRPFDLLQGAPSAELQMLRSIARLLEQTGDYLLLGRMLPAPAVSGSPLMPRPAAPGPNQVRGKSQGKPQQHDNSYPALPVAWPIVQATAWRSAAGNVCYALANLSHGPQAIELHATANGMPAANVRLVRVGPDDRRTLLDSTPLPATVRLDLSPWEMLCVEQTPAARKN